MNEWHPKRGRCIQLETIIRHPPGLGFTAIREVARDRTSRKVNLVWGMIFAYEMLLNAFRANTDDGFADDGEFERYVDRSDEMGEELDEMLGSERRYRSFGKPYAGGFIVRAVRTRYQMLARARVLREKVGGEEQGKGSAEGS